MSNNEEPNKQPEQTPGVTAQTPPPPQEPPKMIQVNEEEWKDVQERLKMLYEVADKGRVYNYENSKAKKKNFKIKLAKFKGGVIIGWRTVKDNPVYHPTTGKQVGEEQEYEVIIDSEGKLSKAKISGYPAFSEARYADRVECEVRGKKEDFDGKITYDVALPDGRVLQLDARFVN